MENIQIFKENMDTVSRCYAIMKFEKITLKICASKIKKMHSVVRN
jgi:hypothetical protein